MTPHLFESTMDTPAGLPFTIIVDGDGAVLAAGWTPDSGHLLPLVHPRLRTQPQPHTQPQPQPRPQPRLDLGQVTKAARAYFDGDLAAPAAIAVHQHTSGDFLPHAWSVLREVAPGRPISYTELAARAGRPAAARAAAQACARNAAALFVPCHRVVRGDGGLGGFRWGLEVKRWLLNHEANQSV